MAFSVSFTSPTSPPAAVPAGTTTRGAATRSTDPTRPPVRWATAAWQWGPRSRRITTAVAAVALSVAAAALARAELGPSSAVPWLATLAAVTLAAGAVGGRRGNHTLGVALLLTGGVTAALTLEAVATAQDWPPAAWGSAGAAVCAGTGVLLGSCTTLGRAGHVGAVAVVATALVWQVLAVVPADVASPAGRSRWGALAAVVGVVTLGVLPRLAIVRAGLTGPGGRPAAGDGTGAPLQADTARAAAHGEFVPATVVLAASSAVAGWLLLESAGAWTVGSALLLAGMLLARAWAYPLTLEVAALSTAAAVPLVRLFLWWTAASGERPYAPLLVLCALAAVPFALLAVDLPARAYRGWPARAAQRAEAVGVVLLVAMAMGVFGVYTPLLDAF